MLNWTFCGSEFVYSPLREVNEMFIIEVKVSERVVPMMKGMVLKPPFPFVGLSEEVPFSKSFSFAAPEDSIAFLFYEVWRWIEWKSMVQRN